MNVYKAQQESDLLNIAKALIAYADDTRVIVLNGAMGAGKTTFVRYICNALDSDDEASSPTFSLVNEYRSNAGPIYHFDFYRIHSEEEALDIGIEDYLYSGFYCLIEWAEKIPHLLPQNYVSVAIEILNDQQRSFRFFRQER